MRLFKHILLAIALLAALLPCSHASTHGDHAGGFATDAAAVNAAPCKCHTCALQPCSENLDLHHDRSAHVETIEPPAPLLAPYIFPEPKTVPPPSMAALPRALANLRTVQLLI